MNWTTPYHGVQHTDGKKLWASVVNYGTFAESHVWTPGCGFSPEKVTHETPESARKYAEERITLLSRGVR